MIIKTNRKKRVIEFEFTLGEPAQFKFMDFQNKWKNLVSVEYYGLPTDTELRPKVRAVSILAPEEIANEYIESLTRNFSKEL